MRGPGPTACYSASQCTNQRLPNGNTSITITETGHIIEVTQGVLSGVNYLNKEVVWEFINPALQHGDCGGRLHLPGCELASSMTAA